LTPTPSALLLLPAVAVAWMARPSLALSMAPVAALSLVRSY